MKRQDTLSTYEFHDLFPDEAAAVAWYEAVRWPDGRQCPHCESGNTVACGRPQPYRCRACRKHFSVKTGTMMQSSKLPVKKWLYAMYLMSVSKKGLSSCQLARELGIAQEAAWRLGHKIREAWNQDALFPMNGPIEVDETYMGGKEKNKHADKKIPGAAGTVGKTPVIGVKDRETNTVQAAVIERTDRPTLSGFVNAHTTPDTTVYSDEHSGYDWVPNREVVRHSAKEYVRDQAHTNGIESFWSLLKRGYVGTFHKMSVKHLPRYVDEFCFRHNHRSLHALRFMERTAINFVGRVLPHRALVQEGRYGGTGNPAHSGEF